MHAISTQILDLAEFYATEFTGRPRYDVPLPKLEKRQKRALARHTAAREQCRDIIHRALLAGRNRQPLDEKSEAPSAAESRKRKWDNTDWATDSSRVHASEKENHLTAKGALRSRKRGKLSRCCFLYKADRDCNSEMRIASTLTQSPICTSFSKSEQSRMFPIIMIYFDVLISPGYTHGEDDL